MQLTAYECQLNGHHRPWPISLEAPMACCKPSLVTAKNAHSTGAIMAVPLITGKQLTKTIQVTQYYN